MTGRCWFCRCTELEPCPGGCGWVDRRQPHTLCTACVDVERAWRALPVSRKPNMHRAFFRGFMAATFDERVLHTDWGLTPKTQPYAGGITARYWVLGYKAGAQAAQTVEALEA